LIEWPNAETWPGFLDLGGSFWMKFESTIFEANVFPPAAGSFKFGDKSSKKHNPKPKSANGLHFVWGQGYFFCLGGG